MCRGAYAQASLPKHARPVQAEVPETEGTRLVEASKVITELMASSLNSSGLVLRSLRRGMAGAKAPKPKYSQRISLCSVQAYT